MTVDEQVGARIKARRRKLRLNHDIVAKMIGCSVSQIMRYEAGSTSAKPELLLHMSEILGCKPGYFFEGIDV